MWSYVKARVVYKDTITYVGLARITRLHAFSEPESTKGETKGEVSEELGDIVEPIKSENASVTPTSIINASGSPRGERTPTIVRPGPKRQRGG